MEPSLGEFSATLNVNVLDISEEYNYDTKQNRSESNNNIINCQIVENTSNINNR